MYRCNFKNRTVFFAFVFNHSSDHAGEQCSPLRGNIGYDQARHKRNGQAHSLQGSGKAFAPNQNNNCVQRPLSRLRRQLPLRRGANGVRRKIRTALLGSGSFSVLSETSIPGCRNNRMGTASIRHQKMPSPSRGRCRACATDEVKFKSVRHSRTPQLFIIHSQAQPALSALKPFCEAKPNKRA